MAYDIADATNAEQWHTLTRLKHALHGPNTLGNSRNFWIGFAVVLALFATYPIYMLPYAVNNMTLFLLFGFLGLSLTVIWGYAGILSFGQVAFFGIAGYTFGVITLNVTGPVGTTVGVLTAVVLAALSASLLGYFMFYGGVSDVYVTIITLVVTLVLHTFTAQTAGDSWTIGEAPLGGFNGMPEIPSIAFGVERTVVVLEGTALYYAVLVGLVLTYLGLRVLVNSDYGRVMVAIREDPDRTEMFGYNVKRVKLVVFTFGGALAGLSGVLYASWGHYIDPGVFSLTFASLPVIWVAAGGRKTLAGALIGTIVLQRVSQWLSINAPDFAFVINGVILLVIVLVMPEGAIPRVHDAITARLGLRANAEADADGARREVAE